jgi:hypothetical protein
MRITRFLPWFAVALILYLPPASAQTYHAGMLEIEGNWTARQNFKNANNIRFADQFAGADAGAKIAAAIADLPAAGGIVDARGLEEAPQITSTLVIAKEGVTVLLPPGLIAVSANPGIQVQADGVRLIGVGRDSEATNGTVLSYVGAAGGRLLDLRNATRKAHMVFQDFVITTALGGTTIGMDIEDVTDSDFVRLRVVGFGTNLRIDSLAALSYRNKFYNCAFLSGVSFNVDIGPVNATNAGFNSFYSCQVTAGNVGVRVASSGNVFVMCDISGHTSDGVVIQATAHQQSFFGGLIETNGGWGINRNVSANGLVVSGTTFSSNTSGDISAEIVFPNDSVLRGGSTGFVTKLGGLVLRRNTAGTLLAIRDITGDTSDYNVFDATDTGIVRAKASLTAGSMTNPSAGIQAFVHNPAAAGSGKLRIQGTGSGGSSGAYADIEALPTSTGADTALVFSTRDNAGIIAEAARFVANTRNFNVSKSIISGLNTVSFSATPTFNASLGNTQKITLTANVTSSTLSNASTGQTINFIICQDATGSRTFVWPTNVLGGMTIGATASKCSAQNFIFDGTNAYALSPGVTNQ